ncbi:MAG TPA: four helix bundle protein [Tenuifilaceae bacterium]|nr:four helix bundle protein [Tenuifilaceae bacterium]
MDRKFDLEERLINFAVRIIELAESLKPTKANSYLSGQILRSGTAPALQYGEAQSSESRKDFVHKMKIALKELRETLVCLKVIHRSSSYNSEQQILNAINESNELISIFVKSIDTAQKNMITEKK